MLFFRQEPAGELKRDNSRRGSGSPQRLVQKLENGETGRGESKKKKEQGSAQVRWQEIQRVAQNHVFPLNILVINAVILIFHAIQILQVGAHLLGSLGHLGHLHMRKPARFEQRTAHFAVENGIAAVPLEFR
jgi:hypothetical protein